MTIFFVSSVFGYRIKVITFWSKLFSYRQWTQRIFAIPFKPSRSTQHSMLTNLSSLSFHLNTITPNHLPLSGESLIMGFRMFPSLGCHILFHGASASTICSTTSLPKYGPQISYVVASSSLLPEWTPDFHCPAAFSFWISWYLLNIYSYFIIIACHRHHHQKRLN